MKVQREESFAWSFYSNYDIKAYKSKYFYANANIKFFDVLIIPRAEFETFHEYLVREWITLNEKI